MTNCLTETYHIALVTCLNTHQRQCRNTWSQDWWHLRKYLKIVWYQQRRKMQLQPYARWWLSIVLQFPWNCSYKMPWTLCHLREMRRKKGQFIKCCYFYHRIGEICWGHTSRESSNCWSTIYHKQKDSKLRSHCCRNWQHSLHNWRHWLDVHIYS